MKAQRLKITEKGMLTYSDYYCGVKFTNGLSDDPVAPSVALQIGSYIRVDAVDDGEQVGEARSYLTNKTSKAPVIKPLAGVTPKTESPASVAKTVSSDRHTKESLAKVADESGIGGLRSIADAYGVKGRGIVELITEILQAQG